MWQTHSASAEETFVLGRVLGERAFPGTVVILSGDLGAGKTALARGVGAGLAVRSRVQSPSFAVLQAHEGGRLPFWHVDLYRLESASELDSIGLDEALEGQGVVVIEWGERFPQALPADRLELRLEEEGEGRRISVNATGPVHQQLEVLDGA